MADRVAANAIDADLLDQVVARGGCIEGRHVGGPGEEARAAVRVLELRLEAEWAGVRLPADECRLEHLGEIRPDVEPAVSRAAAQPLDAAADREVDVQRCNIERHDSGGLISVEDDVRADLVCAVDDRGDFLDLRRLEENVRDRNEQGAFVDRFDDGGVVLHDHDVELRLSLVQVADARKVALFVNDAVAVWIDRPEAGHDDRLRDRDVLVHDGRAGRSPDDAADLIPDGHRHLPPALAPGTDAAFLPHPRVLEHAFLGGRRHRAERVVDEVRRIAEDREPLAVLGQLHAAQPSPKSRRLVEPRPGVGHRAVEVAAM